MVSRISRIGRTEGRAAAFLPSGDGDATNDVDLRRRAAQEAVTPGDAPLPGRIYPFTPPVMRPRRSYAAKGVGAALAALCVGLLVWEWQERSGHSPVPGAIATGWNAQQAGLAARPEPPPLQPAAPVPASPAAVAAVAAKIGIPTGVVLPAPEGAWGPDDVLAGGDAPVKEPAQFATAAGAPTPTAALLIGRGDEYLGNSDVVSARLFYRRAAEEGSGEAAAAMARTFDPSELERRAVRGATSDPTAALDWYRRAAELGDTSASAATEVLLRRLQIEASAGDPKARAALERALR